MNPGEVCERAVDIMMEVLRGERHDVGYVELLPGEYCARGTMRASGPRMISPGTDPDSIDVSITDETSWRQITSMI